MKNKIFITFFMNMLSCQAQAHIPSLFHTQKEEQEIHANRKVSQTSSQISPTSTNEFHLSGLLYSGPNNWKIWINKKPYNKKNFPGLEVTHITPFKVSFTYTQGTHRTSFTLAPNGRHPLIEAILP